MNIYWILFIVSLCISSIGWKKFIYFISIGYGFSISGCAVAMVVNFWDRLTAPTIILCLLLFAYGCRLSGYLLYRTVKSANYRKVLAENTKDEGYPFGVTMAIWVSCAFLYLAEVCPVASRLYNGAADDIWAWLGAAVMLLGLTIETIADRQKSAAKKIRPDYFVSTGLYKIVRCPNYFGEMLTWTGCLIVGIGAGLNWWQWLISAFGYLGIVYIMFSGARRLELRQSKTYALSPAYQYYKRNTPILIPGIPLYTLAKHNWLRG